MLRILARLRRGRDGQVEAVFASHRIDARLHVAITVPAAWLVRRNGFACVRVHACYLRIEVTAEANVCARSCTFEAAMDAVQ